jgi:hypothetical protein
LHFSFMKSIPRPALAFIIVLLTITAGGISKTEATITAELSEFSVKISSVENGDCGFTQESGTYLSPAEGNTYTVCKGTTLIFEVEAQISQDVADEALTSEWYNSSNLNDGTPIASINWWWWVNATRNQAAPPQAPEQPNNPDAIELTNTRKGGFFSFEQSFEDATPSNKPIKITVALYASQPGPSPCPTVVIDFFVNVAGTPDQTPPDLTPGPAQANITVGLADRVELTINAIDPKDNLEAIEWYVEGFNLPLRSSGVGTLDLFLGSPNDDSFKYRFQGVGRTFELTALAYDNFGNDSIFKWDVTVEEPLLTRASPSAAEISVSPFEEKTFEILADENINRIDGVHWQNNQGTSIYMPVTEATSRGHFLVFAWETSFNFDDINDFFETTEITATAYIEDESSAKAPTGNTVNWKVRAEKHVDNNQTVNFSGLEWKVKQSTPSTQTIGPGNNYFSGSNVSADSEGLHLRITQEDDRWLSAELFTVNSMPRGIYRFYLEGGNGTRLDQLDSKVIFSPFFYADDTREIDIEFSNWLENDIYGAGQFQYIVQPVGADSIKRYELTLDDSAANSGKITCQIDWQDDRVIFTSWLGHSTTPSSLLLETWTYEGSFLPESGDELKLHLNLYLKNNFIPDQDNSPGNGLPVHVIIKAIDHPVSWHAWRVKNFGERQVFAPSTISGAQDDLDFDGYPNLLEYALGSDPWRFDPERQPQLEIYEDPNSQEDEDYLSYTFTRRKAQLHPLYESLGGIHHTPFLDYYIKSKTDLGDTITDWMDEPLTLIGDPTDLSDGTETIIYRTENAIDQVPQKFFQLQVEARDE